MTNFNLNKLPPSYAPVYAAMYPELAEVANCHGYALAIHGSLQRDFDLIAVPWVWNAKEPEILVDAITSEFAVTVVGTVGEKPHQRKVWSLSVGHGECAIDLSFAPMPDLTETKPNNLPKAEPLHRRDYVREFFIFCFGAATACMVMHTLQLLVFN